MLLNKEEDNVGKRLFSSETKDFDLGLYFKYREALELYIAMHFIKNLKYFLNKNGTLIFPIQISLSIVNQRFITIVKNIRNKIECKSDYHNNKLRSNLQQTGLV